VFVWCEVSGEFRGGCTRRGHAGPASLRSALHRAAVGDVATSARPV